MAVVYLLAVVRGADRLLGRWQFRLTEAVVRYQLPLLRPVAALIEDYAAVRVMVTAFHDPAIDCRSSSSSSHASSSHSSSSHSSSSSSHSLSSGSFRSVSHSASPSRSLPSFSQSSYSQSGSGAGIPCCPGGIVPPSFIVPIHGNSDCLECAEDESVTMSYNPAGPNGPGWYGVFTGCSVDQSLLVSLFWHCEGENFVLDLIDASSCVGDGSFPVRLGKLGDYYPLGVSTCCGPAAGTLFFDFREIEAICGPPPVECTGIPSLLHFAVSPACTPVSMPTTGTLAGGPGMWSGGATTACGPGSGSVGWMVILYCNEGGFSAEIINGSTGSQVVQPGDVVVLSTNPFHARITYTPAPTTCCAGIEQTIDVTEE